MPELRLNLIAKEWVIIATERSKKPSDFIAKKERKIHPEHDPSCPFCPGNEGRTPAETFWIGDGRNWKLRVTQNRFSALSLDGPRERRNEGNRHIVTGVGRHEVIIESPLHNAAMASMDIEDITSIIRTYNLRFKAIHEDPRVEHVIIFRNHGEGSGTSLTHPHSQIIGTPVTPIHVRNRLEDSIRFFDNTGECLMCAIIRDEISDGKRIIKNSDHFLTLIPFAALSPFHTWIFPKRHSATFGDIREEEVHDLAAHLSVILSKFRYGLEDPDYNLIVRSEGPALCGSEHFHWYVSIVPRVSHSSGFELGSGMYINPTVPEEIAEFLRNVRP